MNELAHMLTTRLALDLAGPAFRPCASGGERADLILWSAETDHFLDVEFVDVQGGRDDPHRREWNALDDRAHYLLGGRALTSFNHFLDIQKGPGRFDDYDGYSYFHGSARRNQHQPASQVAERWAYLAAVLGGFKVDEGIQYWLNDEYVHAPGQPWYRNCSPALLHYSFPGDLGIYATQEAELRARFPLAASRGSKGRGFPYSVFMPVDNLARYWFEKYQRSRAPRARILGPVLHAVQDASIPHHAAGCNGNWHVEYERGLDGLMARFASSRAFQAEARAKLRSWVRRDAHPPVRRLTSIDLRRQPALNWPVAQLVTWVALHAYREYSRTYGGFRRGFRPDLRSLRRLGVLATAMSALVLMKAAGEKERRGKHPKTLARKRV